MKKYLITVNGSKYEVEVEEVKQQRIEDKIEDQYIKEENFANVSNETAKKIENKRTQWDMK